MHSPYIITRIIYNNGASKKKKPTFERIFGRGNEQRFCAQKKKKRLIHKLFSKIPKIYTSSWNVGHLFGVAIRALLRELFVVKWFYRCRTIRPLAHSCSATRSRCRFRMSVKSFRSGPLSFRLPHWSASSPCPPPWSSFVFFVFSSI